MIYYIIALCLLPFSIANQYLVKKADLRLFTLLVCLFFLFFGGARFQVGADWYSYEEIFNATFSFEDLVESRQEKLFILSIIIIKSFSSNYGVFVFGIFAFSFLLKAYIINRYSVDFFLSILIYLLTVFLLYDVNGIRQGVAISFTLLSLPFILKKKLSLFLLCISISVLFHTSAIVFLPFYWLSTVNYSVRKTALIVMFSVLLAIPLQLIIQNSSAIQLLLALESFSHYSTYVGNENIGGISLLGVGLIQRLFLFFTFVFYYDKIKVSQNYKRTLFNAYAISIVLYVLFSFSSEFASRLSYYYKCFDILIIPLLVWSQNTISSRVILLFFFVIFYLFGASRLLAIEGNGLIPYSNSIIH